MKKRIRLTRTTRMTEAERAEMRDLRAKFAQDIPELLETRDDTRDEARTSRNSIRTSIENVMPTLRAVREASAITLEEIEKRTGINPSNLSRLERDREKNPTIDTVVRIAKALGKRIVISIEDLPGEGEIVTFPDTHPHARELNDMNLRVSYPE